MTILDKFMIALGFQVDDTGLEKFENRAQSVRESAIGLADVVSGVLTTAFVELFKSFVDTSAEFEKYSVVLGVLYDSADKGREAMNWISDFAVKTPYQLQDLTQAFIRLKAFGLDPTAGVLRTVGDTAAAFGRPLMDAVFAMNDAIEGINRPLRTFGISVKEHGDQVTYSYIKNGKQIEKTINKTNKLVVAQTLEAIWNDRYGGAMDKLSTTWSGMLTNIKDQITRFKQKVMNAGPFVELKGQLQQILDIINKASSDGTVTKFAVLFDVGVQAVVRTTKALYWVLDEVISHTVGWKVALSALAFVLTGVLASSIAHTISLVSRLLSTVLAFDLATTGIFLIAAALVLVIDDLYNYYKGNASIIGQLQQKFPFAVGLAYAAIMALVGGFIALKWATITSLVETISIMALYAAEWAVTAATTLWGLGAMVVAAAATAVGWIASFASMAVATIAATWPVLAVIAVLALLGFAVYELWKHWDKVTGGIRKAWHFVVDEIKAGVAWIIRGLNEMADVAWKTINKLPGGVKLLELSAKVAMATGIAPQAPMSSVLGGPTAGGGVIGRAGSNFSTQTSHSTSTHIQEGHTHITVVSPDPDQAGKSVKRELDRKRRQVVRNGQSAVAY